MSTWKLAGAASVAVYLVAGSAIAEEQTLRFRLVVTSGPSGGRLPRGTGPRGSFRSGDAGRAAIPRVTTTPPLGYRTMNLSEFKDLTPLHACKRARGLLGRKPGLTAALDHPDALADAEGRLALHHRDVLAGVEPDIPLVRLGAADILPACWPAAAPAVAPTPVAITLPVPPPICWPIAAPATPPRIAPTTWSPWPMLRSSTCR